MRISTFSTRALKALPTVFTFITAVLSAGGIQSQAQTVTPPKTDGAVAAPGGFQYSAKFICGVAPVTKPPLGGPVAPGTYYTAINVHDPAMQGGTELRKKFAIALPGEKVGKISGFTNEVLKADEAMEIDCPDILRHLEIKPGQFVKGFAVIQSTRELDVVAVYTAAASATGPVVTLEIERVPKR